MNTTAVVSVVKESAEQAAVMFAAEHFGPFQLQSHFSLQTEAFTGPKGQIRKGADFPHRN